MIVMDLRKAVQKGEKREKILQSKLVAMASQLRELNIKLEMKAKEFKIQEQMAKVSEEQMNQLRRHIETISAAAKAQ